ncbi:hypothetical protein GF420_08745 [candidate division GN15 bacterium]|nr:hypothetical protein [candidate division GN15 bacterium]
MATRTKTPAPTRRQIPTRETVYQHQSGPTRFLRACLGCCLFVIAVVGATVFLQQTLVLYHAADVYVHWSAILLVIPLTVGYILRLNRTPYIGWVLLIGGLCAATVVYPWYYDYWAEPPPLWAAAVYAVITAGVGSIPHLPFRRLFGKLFRPNGKKKKTVRKVIKGRKPQKNRLAPVKEMISSGSYSAMIDTIQLVIAILSLLISLISIGLLAIPF